MEETHSVRHSLASSSVKRLGTKIGSLVLLPTSGKEYAGGGGSVCRSNVTDPYPGNSCIGGAEGTMSDIPPADPSPATEGNMKPGSGGMGFLGDEGFDDDAISPSFELLI